ncbi:MAG: hypothetical protein R2843_06405 [Thermomicrobiales bacterium]
MVLDFYARIAAWRAGTIPGAAHPELFIHVQLFRAGDVAGARRCFRNRFLPLLSLMWRSLDHLLYTQKEILHRRGVLGPARLRTPAEVDAAFVRELDQLLSDLGIAELGPNGTSRPLMATPI